MCKKKVFMGISFPKTHENAKQKKVWHKWHLLNMAISMDVTPKFADLSYIQEISNRTHWTDP